MKPCPKCCHPESHIQEYDGDYWRVCKYCGCGTRAFSTRPAATKEWENRDLSPQAKDDRQIPEDGGDSYTEAASRNLEFEVANTTSPSKMDRPNGPGWWLCWPDEEGFRRAILGFCNCLYLSPRDLEYGAPFATAWVYGPLPLPSPAISPHKKSA